MTLMANALKSKICWHCDGSLDVEEEKCSYCGTLQQEPVAERVVPLPLPEMVKMEEKSHFLDRFSAQELQLTLLISTMMGATLLLFTLCLLMFSTNGVFTLRWDAHWWPLFGLLSGGLLYLSFLVNKKC